MHGRIFMAAAAIAALLFAGCIQAPAFSADKTEVSAMANHDLAENAAKAWNPDATLVGAGAGELATARDPLPADPTPGNGKAVAWTYIYMAGNESRAFEVAADGHLVSGNSSDGRAEHAMKDAAPMGAWKIDSVAAIEKADTNDTFARVAKTPNATFGEIVGRETGKDSPALWYIVAFSPQGAVVAQVDAVTGELMMVQEINMGFPMPDMGAYNVHPQAPKPVKVASKGTLDDAKPATTLNFTLPNDGMTGTLRLSIQKPVIVDGIAWNLKGPDGQIVKQGSLNAPQPSESQTWKIPAVGAGAYTLTLTYQSGSPVPMPGGRGVDYALNLVFGADSTPAEG